MNHSSDIPLLEKKRLYFVIINDSNHNNIIHTGSGASELLFYRTIFALSAFFDIIVYNCGEKMVIDGIQYINFSPNDLSFIKDISQSTIIIQRFFDKAMHLHTINATNRYIVWSHDYIESSIYWIDNKYTYNEFNKYFSENQIDVVAVSQFHKKNLLSYMPSIHVKTIYNALFPELYLKHNNISVNTNSILFASNWAKGLDRALCIGKHYYQINPNFKLRLIKPSYCNYMPDLTRYPFIEIIGCIQDKSEYCRLMQSCLCVLTTSYPETFGCVFAEALHLGVPVIADTSVSAGYVEFVSSHHQCNFNHPDQVISLIEQFRANKPDVSLSEYLYGDAIVQEWKQLILSKDN